MVDEIDEKWLTQNKVKFSVATLEDADEIKSFLMENFVPDEPITRSMGIHTGDGWVDKYARYLFYKEDVMDPLKQNAATIPCSILARSTTDNSIVGCRIGAIYHRNSLQNQSFVPHFLGDLPKWVGVPQKLIHGVNMQSLYRDVHYSQADAFSESPDSGDVIYFATCLCVSKQRRGEGLGAEMLKRAYKIAYKSDCKYTFVLVTGMYSQKVFHKLGGTTVLLEARYEDYRVDSKGRPFLNDTREHDILQVLSVEHSKVLF